VVGGQFRGEVSRTTSEVVAASKKGLAQKSFFKGGRAMATKKAAKKTTKTAKKTAKKSACKKK